MLDALKIIFEKRDIASFMQDDLSPLYEKSPRAFLNAVKGAQTRVLGKEYPLQLPIDQYQIPSDQTATAIDSAAQKNQETFNDIEKNSEV